MSDERIKLRGRLAETEQKQQELFIRFRSTVTAIRGLLDPYESPLALDVLGAADQMKILLETQSAMADTTALIERLKKDIGE